MLRALETFVHKLAPAVENVLHLRHKLAAARQGNASADVARTYLLLALQNMDAAYYYLDKFCEKTGTSPIYVKSWLPLVAAAQLTKRRPEEEDLLRSWLDVVDID